MESFLHGDFIIYVSYTLIKQRLMDIEKWTSFKDKLMMSTLGIITYGMFDVAMEILQNVRYVYRKKSLLDLFKIRSNKLFFGLN